MNSLKLAFLLAAVMLAAGALKPAVLLAQEDAPVAPDNASTPEEPAQAQAIPSPGKPPADEDTLAQARLDRVRYEQVVMALENDSGGNTYSADLAEAYLNLATTLEVLQEYEDAARVYDLALQMTRITNGLNSLQQVPVLEKLQENSLVLQDWDKVDSYSHLGFHLARRNFPVGDLRRVLAVRKLGEWKLRVAREALTTSYRGYARDTIAIYDNEFKLIEGMPDFENKGIYLAALHLGEARAKLTQAELVLAMPLGDFRTSAPQSTTTQRCRAIRLPDGRVTQVCETVEVPNLDYYLDPSIRKNQEISKNLLDIRRAITEAYDELQKDGDVDQRNALLAEMQEVTQAYNAFIIDNQL